MASTAEELSSQAEQLQRAVAFFRLDEGAVAGRQTVRPATRPAAKKQTQMQVSHMAHANGYGKSASALPKVAVGDGVFLDLGEGKDRLDSEFEKY